MTALLLNCSPRGEESRAHVLAREWLGGRACIERDLAADPLPPLGMDYADAVAGGPGGSASFTCSEQLIAELERTDLLVISTPMHNFTVPASLKLWIDYVLRIHRSFSPTPAGKVGLLWDRPTLVLVASGGFHLGERANQPDFLTPYLRHVLRTVGIVNVQFVYLQGLARGPQAVQDALDAARKTLDTLAFKQTMPA